MSDPRSESFARESRELIDEHFDKTLPAASEPPGLLHEAMRYAVFSGGKRLRPTLAFAGALAAGADPRLALPAAAAVELVHTYSLVHDDLPCMDDDDQRRGRPTVHVRYGEANAVLVGDALLAEAFLQLAAGEPAARLVGALAQAAGSRALVGGQLDDLARSTPGSLAAITSIHLRKTAALFRFSVAAGATLGGLPASELDQLDRFGRAYGLAFQLADDLADDDPDECSILRVLEAPQARGRALELIDEALRALAPLGERGWALRGLADALRGRLP